MRGIINIYIAFIMIISFIISSCKYDEPEPEPIPVTIGNVQFRFINEIDGQSIQAGNISYTNEAGNVYSVDELFYYISNMTFIKDDGTEYKTIENYELIDHNYEDSKTFELDSIPFGIYTSIRFNVGVDSTRNFAGPLTGDLDPVLGMLWDWQTGYVYFKHEGYFIDSTGVQQEVHFHYGTLKALVTEEIPISLEVNSEKRIVDVTFNLNKVYRSPNLMDFNGENWHQSTGPGENGWVQLIKQNFEDAFEITHVQ